MMAKTNKETATQRWISFDGQQANLSAVVAVASTIKGAQIEKKTGVVRIYIPKQTLPGTSFPIAKVLRDGKFVFVKKRKEQPNKQHYCAIMLK